METYPLYWSFVQGIHQSPVKFPPHGPVTWNFDVLFDLCLNKRLSKQSRRRYWFEKPSHSLWRHFNKYSSRMKISQAGMLFVYIGNLYQQLSIMSFITEFILTKFIVLLGTDMFKIRFTTTFTSYLFEDVHLKTCTSGMDIKSCFLPCSPLLIHSASVNMALISSPCFNPGCLS